MRKNISIFLYSYKNKNLENIVYDILQKTSKTNNIRLFVFDQTNVSRVKDFYKFPTCVYTHIYWDTVIGPSYFREKVLKNNDDYYLEISDNVELIKDWDIKILDFVKNDSNIIVSGKGISELYYDSFLIKNNEKQSDKFQLNNWIDLNFLFIDKSIKEYLKILNKLKYYGQDLLLSFIFYKNNFKIYSVDSSFYNIKQNNILSKDYIPYSLYHGYNDMVEYILDNKSDFINFINNKLEIDKIDKLPFDPDDVKYQQLVAQWEFDMHYNRFINGWNNIKFQEVSLEKEAIIE